MPKLLRALPIAVACAACGIAAAGEVLYFENGTTLPVRSHEIRNGMIHVQLDDDASFAFPQYMVERVEAAGEEARSVVREVGKDKKARRRARPAAETDEASQGASPYRKPDGGLRSSDSRVEVDPEMGVAVYKPFARGDHAAKRQLGASGSQYVATAPLVTVGEQGIAGTRPLGRRHSLGNRGPRGPLDESSRPPVTGIELREPTVAPAGDDSGGGDGQGSGS